MSEKNTTKKEKQTTQQKIDKINERITNWYTCYSENIIKYQDDMEFLFSGDTLAQWSTEEIMDYKIEKKPTYTFNLLLSNYEAICNEMFDVMPDLEVKKVTADNDKFDNVPIPQEIKIKLIEKQNSELKDVAEKIIQDICLSSDSQLAYEISSSNALSGGFGAVLVDVEPDAWDSFDYRIRIKPIRDATNAFWDPSAMQTDKLDGVYAGYFFKMSKEELEEEYPYFDFSQRPSYSAFYPSTMSPVFEWIDDKDSTCVVIEYFQKEFFHAEWALLSNGLKIEAKDIPIALERDSNLTVIKKEKRKDYTIKRYRIFGDQILSETDWDGKFLPVVFQGGSVKYMMGEERTFSFIRYVKEVQRAYNILHNEFLLRIATTRHSQIAVDIRTITTAAARKAISETRSNNFLYDGSVGGNPPIVLPVPEIPQSLTIELTRLQGDLKAMLGRYDASLGAPSNEESAKAIYARREPADFVAKVFYKGAARTVDTLGKVVGELLPKIYDTHRVLTVGNKEIEINKPINQYETSNFIAGNKYNVCVKNGLPFEKKKLEEFNKLMLLSRSINAMIQVAPDEIIERSGIPNMDKIIERIKKYSIPQITAAEEAAKTGQAAPKQQPSAQDVAMLKLAEAEEMKAKAAETTALVRQIESATNRLKVIGGITNNQNNFALKVEELKEKKNLNDVDVMETFHKLQSEDKRTQEQLYEKTEQSNHKRENVKI